MEEYTQFNFKEFCSQTSNLALNEIYEAINEEWNRVNKYMVASKEKKQYQEDLLILLNLF